MKIRKLFIPFLEIAVLVCKVMTRPSIVLIAVAIASFCTYTIGVRRERFRMYEECKVLQKNIVQKLYRSAVQEAKAGLRNYYFKEYIENSLRAGVLVAVTFPDGETIYVPREIFEEVLRSMFRGDSEDDDDLCFYRLERPKDKEVPTD